MKIRHQHFRKSIKGLIVEKITDAVRQRCPVPFRPDVYYMAHFPPSPRYVLGKSPNDARKAYVRLKREGTASNDD